MFWFQLRGEVSDAAKATLARKLDVLETDLVYIGRNSFVVLVHHEDAVQYALSLSLRTCTL